MEALTKLTGSSRPVRKGKIILMAALITTLFDGFGSQAGAQPQTAATRKVRRSRLFGQLPGRNKLRLVAG
jgi:hypothetical protein